MPTPALATMAPIDDAMTKNRSIDILPIIIDGGTCLMRQHTEDRRSQRDPGRRHAVSKIRQPEADGRQNDD